LNSVHQRLRQCGAWKEQQRDPKSLHLLDLSFRGIPRAQVLETKNAQPKPGINAPPRILVSSSSPFLSKEPLP
jgi:hypothetical protein